MISAQTKKDIFLLSIFSLILFVWNIWSGSLLSWDEGFYGSVSKEIFRSGDWINLYWRGAPWSDKPPLYMWASSFFFGIFGINEFSVRFFSAIAGTGTVVAVYFLADRLYSRKEAIASSLVLMSTLHFVWASKVGMLDSTLTLFITLSFLFFHLGLSNRKMLFFSPLFFCLAFMTKGVAAMIIPLVILTYAAFSGNFRKLFDPFILAGAMVSLILLSAWHVAAFQAYRGDFIKGYFLEHLIKRTTTAMDDHAGNFFTYLRVIPNKGRPWMIAGIVLPPVLLYKILRSGEKQHLLPLVWFLCVLLIFSVAQTKLHWYIVPIYPAMAIMTGWFVTKMLGKYTVPVTLTLSLSFLAYLAIDEEIFDLDYSPAIKNVYLRTSQIVPSGKNLFLYDISDPGMMFYMEWSGKAIKGAKILSKVLAEGDGYILIEKNKIPVPADSYTVVEEMPPFILITS